MKCCAKHIVLYSIQLCHLASTAGNLPVLYSWGSKPVGLFTGKDKNFV